MSNPHLNTPAALFIADRVRDLKHRKSQKEIAHQAGFVNANMLSLLQSGATKVPLDRVPALARALGVDRAYLMHLSLEHLSASRQRTPSSTASTRPVTENERGWLDEICDASLNSDPRLTARSRSTLRAIFGK